MSCPRLKSHDHNCQIENLAARPNVGEKKEQGGGNQCPEFSMAIGGERVRIHVSDWWNSQMTDFQKTRDIQRLREGRLIKISSEAAHSIRQTLWKRLRSSQPHKL